MLNESDKLFAKDITSASDSEVLSEAIDCKLRARLSDKESASVLLVVKDISGASVKDIESDFGKAIE